MLSINFTNISFDKNGKAKTTAKYSLSAPSSEQKEKVAKPKAVSPIKHSSVAVKPSSLVKTVAVKPVSPSFKRIQAIISSLVDEPKSVVPQAPVVEKAQKDDE